MKRFLFLLFSLLPFAVAAQYPTVTTQVSIAKNLNSHGFSVADWITIDDDGLMVKGSDPGTEPLFGVVSKVVNTNNFEYVLPGGPITFSSAILTAGEIYYAQTDGTIEASSTATDTNKPVLKATSTTQGILLSGSFGAIDFPPPSEQVQNILLSDVTSTSITATTSGGSGDGVIMLISASPIAWTPVNNIDYSGAENLNFGSGNDVSGGSFVYVVLYGDEISAVITGLSPATVYYISAYRYAQSGALISYNTSTQGVFNTTSTNTLADATTPTEKYVVTNVKSKQTSLEISGSGCSCDAIVVVANDSIPVSVDIADGVDPVSGDFGSGTNLTERNFVVYEGSPTDFTISGLARDDKIYYKIYERENTGFLYNTNSDVDSAYVAWRYDNTFTEGTGDPPGQVYLTASSDLWYDFSTLTFADEANITNGDAGLTDYSAGTSTATILGSSPQTNEISFNGTHKAARTASGTGIDVNNNGNTWFDDSFEVHWSGQISDAQNGSASVFTSLCGYVSGSNQVALRVMWNGSIRAEYRDGVAASNTSMWSSSGTLADGPQNFTVTARFDFTNDLVSLWVNNTPVSVTLLSGIALSSQDPSNFNSGHDFVVGNQANAGTLVGNTMGVTLSTAHFAVTGLLSSEERTAIHEEFNFTAAAGSEFDNYDVTAGGGFDRETENDTLKYSNGSAGFGDYMTTKEILPDSLQDHIITAPFKIASSPTTNPSSFIIGIRNATTTETNYGVWGHFNLDSDGSFGTVQIFSGTGVIGDASWAFRGGSSGNFEPAQDSTYRIDFEREVTGNDAFYAVTVFDYYDSAVLTIGWTEPNRPSSGYYGTTMTAFMGYQGDTDIHVGEFYVVRTSDAQVDTSPPEPPTTDYDYLASKAPEASDSNPCTVEEPCSTINYTMSVANASGGSNKTVGIASGFYPETSAIVVGTNISLVEGAGPDATIIQAGPNMFGQAPDATSHDIALMRLTSGGQHAESHVTHVVNLKGFTLDGNERRARQGLYIRGRDGWQINDVTIRNFNFTGAWIRYADDFTVNNLIIENSGGDNLTNPLCNNMNPQVATGSGGQGSNTAGLNTWDIENATFNGGGVYNTMFRSGYAHKAQNSSTDASGTYVDVTFNDMDFVTNDQSNYFSNGGLMLKSISFELHSGNQVTNLDSLVFEGCLFQGGFFSFFEYNNAASTGGVRMTGCTFDPGVWPSQGNEPFAAIEAYVNNLKFNRNYIYSSETFYVNNSRSSAPFDYANWTITNNIFKVRPKNNSAIGTIIKAQHHSLVNIYIGNNTIWNTSPTLGQLALVSFNADPDDSESLATNTFTIENTAIYGDVPSGNLNKGIIKNASGAGVSATVRYNKATHQTFQAMSGVTYSNNTTTGAGNTLLFNLTGPEFPVTQSSYFGWTTNAVLDDTGESSSDIGAYSDD